MPHDLCDVNAVSSSVTPPSSAALHTPLFTHSCFIIYIRFCKRVFIKPPTSAPVFVIAVSYSGGLQSKAAGFALLIWPNKPRTAL